MLSPLILAFIAGVVILVILWATGVFKKKPSSRLRQRYHSRLGSTPGTGTDPTTGYPEWLFTNFNINGNNILVGENFDLRYINLNSNLSGSTAKTWYSQMMDQIIQNNDVFTRNPTSGLLNLADMTIPANYGKGAGYRGCLQFNADDGGVSSNTNSSDTTTTISELTKKIGGNISLPLDTITLGITMSNVKTKKTSDTQTYQMASSDYLISFGSISLPLTTDSIVPIPTDTSPTPTSYCITNNINEQFIIDFMNLGMAGTMAGKNTNFGFVGLAKVQNTQNPPLPVVIPLVASDFVDYNGFLNNYGTHVMNKMHFGNRIAMTWNDYSDDSSMSEEVFNSLCVAGASPNKTTSSRENYSSGDDPGDCESINNSQSDAVKQSLSSASIEVLGGNLTTQGPVLALLAEGGYSNFIASQNATVISNFLQSQPINCKLGINFDFTPIWVILEIVFNTFASGYIPSTFQQLTIGNIKSLIKDPNDPTSSVNVDWFNMMITNLKLAYTQLNFCVPDTLNGNASQQLQGFRQVYPTTLPEGIQMTSWIPSPTGMTSECWTNTGATATGDGTGCVFNSDCEQKANGWSEPPSGAATWSGSSIVNVPYGLSCVPNQPQLDPTVMKHVPINDPSASSSTQYNLFQQWSSPGHSNAANCGNNWSESKSFSPTEGEEHFYHNGSPICYNTGVNSPFGGTRVVWDAASQLDTCGNMNLG